MSIAELLLFAHVLSAFWYVMGLAAVQVTLVRGWRSSEASVRAESFSEAAHYQGVLLLPGAIAGVSTGVFLWTHLGYNVAATGWLVALESLYAFTLLVCLPVMGIGLRHMRVAALRAQREGGVTPELEEAMRDSAPLVFSGIATALVPVMALLSIVGPM